MKYSELTSGIFWLFSGVLLSVWSAKYRIGSLAQPGPGFMPFVLGCVLVLLSLFWLFKKGKRSSNTAKNVYRSFPRGWGKVAYIVLILVLTACFFEKVGYLLSFFLLLALSMKGAGPQSWKEIILTAFLSTVGVYLVFVVLLQTQLPRGLLGF